MGNLVSGRVVDSGGIMQQPPAGSEMSGGMVVNEGGDQIRGKWVNTRTGDVVIARQLINDGNEAIVMTDKGAIPMSQFTQYVQMGEEVSGPVGTGGTVESPLITGEDKNILGNLNKPQERRINLDVPLSQQGPLVNNSTTFNKPSESPNYKMIDKLFTKFEDHKPIIKVDIDWNGFPKEQLDNLVDIFDVPREEINEYILKKFLSQEALKDVIKL